jgi:hypothetical protein
MPHHIRQPLEVFIDDPAEIRQGIMGLHHY